MENGKTLITADKQVEELMEKYPETCTYFIMNKVSPISCAGPYPTTLGELLTKKKVQNFDAFIKGLNDFLEQKQKK